MMNDNIETIEGLTENFYNYLVSHCKRNVERNKAHPWDLSYQEHRVFLELLERVGRDFIEKQDRVMTISSMEKQRTITANDLVIRDKEIYDAVMAAIEYADTRPKLGVLKLKRDKSSYKKNIQGIWQKRKY